MTHTHPEAVEYAEHAAELVVAAGGSLECEVCGGLGETLSMVCYGGHPSEIRKWCETCNGTGQVQP